MFVYRAYKKLFFFFCLVAVTLGIPVAGYYFLGTQTKNPIPETHVGFNWIERGVESTKLFTSLPTTVEPVKKYPEILKFNMTKTQGIGTYTPDNLVEIPREISKRQLYISEYALEDLKAMIATAKKEGVDLKAVSGYRSYDEQVDLFNQYVKDEMTNNPSFTRAQAEAAANVYSARPGNSEHQLGTTVDLLSIESNYTFTVNDSMKFVSWIEQNAPKFNFKVSYPKGHPEYMYEPWHLRWYPEE